MMASEDTLNSVREVLARTLQLGDRAGRLDRQTALLGSLPELDSMAVVSVLASIEEHFGVTVEDDEISADTFATLGSLADFVEAKLTG